MGQTDKRKTIGTMVIIAVIILVIGSAIAGYVSISNDIEDVTEPVERIAEMQKQAIQQKEAPTIVPQQTYRTNEQEAGERSLRGGLRPKTPPCDFDSLVGRPVNADAMQTLGRPYRVLPPGSMKTMDHNPARINLETDDDGFVVRIYCG